VAIRLPQHRHGAPPQKNDLTPSNQILGFWGAVLGGVYQKIGGNPVQKEKS